MLSMVREQRESFHFHAILHVCHRDYSKAEMSECLFQFASSGLFQYTRINFVTNKRLNYWGMCKRSLKELQYKIHTIKKFKRRKKSSRIFLLVVFDLQCTFSRNPCSYTQNVVYLMFRIFVV